MKKTLSLLLITFCMHSCVSNKNTTTELDKKVAQYAEVTLTSNIDSLSSNQKLMLSKFFEISDIMDELFWVQAYGNKDSALNLAKTISEKKFIEINYGPWERLKNNEPFIDGVNAKPLGAGFYPADMTKEEFNNFEAKDKKSLYTLIERDSSGELVTVPYHTAYKKQLEQASRLLLEASALAEDDGFKNYLKLRSKALVTDNYLESDLAWMDMKTNKIDFVVGPIENYEDRLYNYKTAFEAYILIKDIEWSRKLDRYAGLLPELQKKLPVEGKYKAEEPGTNSDLGAYDVIYYAGDCNAGSKTIAINLPNDPLVHKEKGSRRLQLKNAMKAKYDKILVPISELLIDSEQQKHVTFDAFFENTMLHEVAHGIGIHHTITTGEKVRVAMKDKSSTIEEGKADILGIFLIRELIEMGELNTNLMDNYVTFTTGIFRSIRFGASSAHGVANLIRYNYFIEHDAISRNEHGVYIINPDSMHEAINSLTEKIITIQGDGDYDKAVELIEKYGNISTELKKDLEAINAKNIPVDIVFKQGPSEIGL